jgi:hypothetical protein
MPQDEDVGLLPERRNIKSRSQERELPLVVTDNQELDRVVVERELSIGRVS